MKTLSWCAGVWWLGIAVVFHTLASLLVHWDPCFPAVWKLVSWSDRCTVLAKECAREGGMTE